MDVYRKKQKTTRGKWAVSFVIGVMGLTMWYFCDRWGLVLSADLGV
jgi:hypothetical protein